MSGGGEPQLVSQLTIFLPLDFCLLEVLRFSDTVPFSVFDIHSLFE